MAFFVFIVIVKKKRVFFAMLFFCITFANGTKNGKIMESNVYVIVENVGPCRNRILKCAFTDKDKALEYASTLREKYDSKCVFDEDLWKTIQDEIIGIYDNIDGEFLTNPYEGGTDEWKRWNEGLDIFEKIKYLELLHKHGLTNATINDVEKQIEYMSYKGKDVLITVEELTLFE